MTVNVIDAVGEPLLAVPTSVAVVPFVLPLEELDLLELLELLPHAAVVIRSAKAIRARAALHLRSFPRVLTSRAKKKMPEVSVMPATTIHGRGEPRRLPGPIILAAVVFTVTVTGMPVVDEVDEVNTTELGLKLQVAPVGRLEQERLTVPVYPFTGYAVTFIVPDAPGLDTVTTGLEDDK